MLAFIVAGVGAGVDVTGGSIGNISPETIRNIAYVAAGIFFVLTVFREVEIWLKQYPKLSLELPSNQIISLGQGHNFEVVIRNEPDGISADRVQLSLESVTPAAKGINTPDIISNYVVGQINPGGFQRYEIITLSTQKTAERSFFLITMSSESSGVASFEPGLKFAGLFT